MSGPPRVRSTNIIPAERGSKFPRKPAMANEDAQRGKPRPSPAPAPAPSVVALRQKSMSASCSSEASCCSSSASSSTSFSLASSSSSSRSGRGGGRRRRSATTSAATPRRKTPQCGPRESVSAEARDNMDSSLIKKRCAWVTPTTDPLYAAFHDEEWGVPVHDDKKLFELLSLSGALAELTWPVILMKRHIFREVFLDFEPVSVAKLNEKKIASQGHPASFLLSEPKLRAIIENSRQICKIREEYGSFDKYIWNFVSHKPIVGQFRYPRQVPVKTPKAEVISKDLVRRGFRSAGPTIIYSFMQVAGLTNDHLINCFRFQECVIGTETTEKVDSLEARTGVEPEVDIHVAVGLSVAASDLKLSQ